MPVALHSCLVIDRVDHAHLLQDHSWHHWHRYAPLRPHAGPRAGSLVTVAAAATAAASATVSATAAGGSTAGSAPGSTRVPQPPPIQNETNGESQKTGGERLDVLSATTTCDSDSIEGFSAVPYATAGEDQAAKDAPPRATNTERLIYFLALAWVIVGVLAFMFAGDPEERMDFITALYFLTQITTTVGYGDICPRSDAMKLFTALYVNFGIIVGAFGISSMTTRMVAKVQDDLKCRLLQGADPLTQHGKSAMALPVVSAITVYSFFLLGGTLFFGLVSTCHCLGCHVTFSGDCEEAGGYHRTFVDAFYMSAITLSTVGFGDGAPGDQVGRVFSIPWMLFGVASLANLVSEMVHLFLSMDIHWERKVDPRLFNFIDKDHNGCLSRYEYITYMLVRYGMIGEGDLDELNHQFDALDRNGDGVITYEDAGMVSPDPD